MLGHIEKIVLGFWSRLYMVYMKFFNIKQIAMVKNSIYKTVTTPLPQLCSWDPEQAYLCRSKTEHKLSSIKPWALVSDTLHCQELIGTKLMASVAKLDTQFQK